MLKLQDPKWWEGCLNHVSYLGFCFHLSLERKSELPLNGFYFTTSLDCFSWMWLARDNTRQVMMYISYFKSREVIKVAFSAVGFDLGDLNLFTFLEEYVSDSSPRLLCWEPRRLSPNHEIALSRHCFILMLWLRGFRVWDKLTLTLAKGFPLLPSVSTFWFAISSVIILSKDLKCCWKVLLMMSVLVVHSS